jgi:hypothetical protein
MEPYEHRRSRRLHRFRYGWSHYTQHRDGIRHGHRRRSHRNKVDVASTPIESIRKSRRFLRGRWPAEIARQVGIGVLLAVSLVFVICAVWGVITIFQARHDLSGAQSEATALAQDRTQLFTAKGRQHALHQIQDMQNGADNAASLVNNSIPLKVLSWIPFVGQQTQGVTDLVNDFDVTSHQANTLLHSVNELVAFSHGTSISLPALDILDYNVRNAVIALRPLDRGSGLLIGPLASARDSFDKQIVKITSLLSTGQQLLTYAGPFLGSEGPRVYLIAGENNAEMRDQGAVLSWALMTANNGTFSMTSPASVGKLALRHPAPYPLPAGTQAAFSLLQPTRVWQSVNASADFPMSGAIMAAMYHQRTHKSVDGVIAIDVPALQHVLEVTGPVIVKNIPGKVGAKNVEYVLLHGLYLLYPKGWEQGLRHDEIAATATAAVKKLNSPKHHYDLAYLVDQLAKASTGRHLLVWSKYPVLEAAVTRFGGSGSLVANGPSAIHLAIESAVAAKLDWYVHTAVTYTVGIDQNGTATIAAKIVVANTAPKNAKPHYIFGPDHINSFVRGQYVARLDLWFPHGASTPGGLRESGLTLARLEVNLLPGQKKTYLITAVVIHAVHDGRFSLHFIPQSSLWAQFSKVIFDARTWSVTGPSKVVWYARGPVTYRWQLSH